MWQNCPLEVSSHEFKVRSIYTVEFWNSQGSLNFSCQCFSLLLTVKDYSLLIGCLDNLWSYRENVQTHCYLQSQPWIALQLIRDRNRRRCLQKGDAVSLSLESAPYDLKIRELREAKLQVKKQEGRVLR